MISFLIKIKENSKTSREKRLNFLKFNLFEMTHDLIIIYYEINGTKIFSTFSASTICIYNVFILFQVDHVLSKIVKLDNYILLSFFDKITPRLLVELIIHTLRWNISLNLTFLEHSSATSRLSQKKNSFVFTNPRILSKIISKFCTLDSALKRPGGVINDTSQSFEEFYCWPFERFQQCMTPAGLLRPEKSLGSYSVKNNKQIIF